MNPLASTLTKEIVDEKIVSMKKLITVQKEMFSQLERMPDNVERKQGLANLILLNDDALKLWAVDTILLTANSSNFSGKERKEISNTYEKLGEDIKEVKNQVNKLFGIRPMVWEDIDNTKNILLKQKQMLLNLANMEEGPEKKIKTTILIKINKDAESLCVIQNMNVINNMPGMGLEDMSKTEIKQIKAFYKTSLNDFKEIHKQIVAIAQPELENKKPGLLSRLFK